MVNMGTVMFTFFLMLNHFVLVLSCNFKFCVSFVDSRSCFLFFFDRSMFFLDTLFQVSNICLWVVSVHCS